MSTEPLPAPHPQVTARTLADGAVLFHAGTETYFGLNPTGTVVWEAIVAGEADVGGVIARLVERHADVTPAQVAGDVRALLAELASAGLVTPRGDASAP